MVIFSCLGQFREICIIVKEYILYGKYCIRILKIKDIYNKILKLNKNIYNILEVNKPGIVYKNNYKTLKLKIFIIRYYK